MSSLRKAKSGMDLGRASEASMPMQGSSKDMAASPTAFPSNNRLSEEAGVPPVRPRAKRAFSLFSRKSSKGFKDSPLDQVPPLPSPLEVVPQLPQLQFEDPKLAAVVMGRSRSGSATLRKWSIGLGSPPVTKVDSGGFMGRQRGASTSSSGRGSMRRSMSASSVLSPAVRSPSAISPSAASFASSATHLSISEAPDSPAEPSTNHLTFRLPELDRRADSPVGRSTRASSVLSAVNPFKSSTNLSRRKSIIDHNPELLQEVLQSQVDEATRSRSRSSSFSNDAAGSLFGRRRASSNLAARLLPAGAPRISPSSSADLLPIPSPVDVHRTPSLESGADTDMPSDLFSASSVNSCTPVSSRKPSLIFSNRKKSMDSGSSSHVHLPMAKEVKAPEVEVDETPEEYVQRVMQLVQKSEVARLLASNSDAFHLQALEAYINAFDFNQEPIDIALRRLLMELFLPRETQQIDRVMEAFAKRWHAQNPVFASSDTAYILAFSLIMLHTDAFNKHNKNKMSKADYVRNTRIDGVTADFLEYLYDNITHQPFIFVDGNDIHGTKSFDSPSVGFSLGSNKTDCYALMAEDQLRRLKPGIEQLIPFKNPYCFSGTVPFLDSSDLHQAFVSTPYSLTVPISSKADGLSASIAASGGLPGAPASSHPNGAAGHITLHISKIGNLLRKEDLVEGGRKSSSRKWREVSVLLSGGQLLFFRDSTWAEALCNQSASSPLPDAASHHLTLPDGKDFKPDQVLSLAGHVALYDFSYVKRSQVFFLVAADGSQSLYQASDPTDMNDWIALINYAAAFKTTGVFMRSGEARPEPLLRRPVSNHSPQTSMSSAGRSTSDSPGTAKRTIYSAQGQIVGSQDVVVDPLWEDESVFEQFSHAPYHSSHRHTSRSHILMVKIAELDQDTLAQKADLRTALMTARALALCRPLVPATRDRLLLAAQPLAKQIRALRLDLCRKVATREVLARDLLTAERDATRSRAGDPSDARLRLRSVSSNVSLPQLLVDHSSSGSSPMKRRRTEDGLLNLMASTRERTRSTPGSGASSLTAKGPAQ